MPPWRNRETEIRLEFYEQAQRDKIRRQAQPDFDATQGIGSNEEPSYGSCSRVVQQRNNPHSVPFQSW